MWTFTTLGYFSIVCARKGPDDPAIDPDSVNIRARSRRHLELLQQACPSLAAYPIKESSPDCDYRYRCVPVPRAAFADAVRDLVLAAVYPNFKAACSAADDLTPEYQHVLHDVWSATRRLQKDEAL